jgi:hypothetical protein
MVLSFLPFPPLLHISSMATPWQPCLQLDYCQGSARPGREAIVLQTVTELMHGNLPYTRFIMNAGWVTRVILLIQSTPLPCNKCKVYNNQERKAVVVTTQPKSCCKLVQSRILTSLQALFVAGQKRTRRHS